MASFLQGILRGVEDEMASVNRIDGYGTRGRYAAALRVLVVEDEEAARVATRRYLQYCGYDVDAAASVSEAITKAATTASRWPGS